MAKDSSLLVFLLCVCVACCGLYFVELLCININVISTDDSLCNSLYSCEYVDIFTEMLEYLGKMAEKL